jgi:hypothetical protein
LVYLRNERFLIGYNKLKEKKIASCQILEMINNNAYKIKLSSNIQTHDLKSWNSYFPPREDDTEQPMIFFMFVVSILSCFSKWLIIATLETS